MTRLLLAVLLGLLPACIEVGPVDNGLMVRDGLELHQDELPVTVELLGGEDLDQDLVNGAVVWWNSEVGFDVLLEDVPGEVTIEEGYVACEDIEEDCPSGVADVGYDATGAILACAVTISSDIAYHRPTIELVLRHELGHCLGLEDDPPSLDLGSIMSDPQYEGAHVTESDAQEIRNER